MMGPNHLWWTWVLLLFYLTSAQDFKGPNYHINPITEPFKNHSLMYQETTYFIVASKIIKLGQMYKLFITILKETQPLEVKASIWRDSVEISSHKESMEKGIPKTLQLWIPKRRANGEYKLRVEGLYYFTQDQKAFVNETKLLLSQPSMTTFVQFDKPVYMQGEMVNFRTIFINTELKPFNDTTDIYILNPNGFITRRWLYRHSKHGVVSLSYQLSDQPVFGEWKIRVFAEQTEDFPFLVEEYYQPKFEVNVVMSPFFMSTDEYIEGLVMANYTNGKPVIGNLWLKAIVRPAKVTDTQGNSSNINDACKKDSNRTIVNKYYNFKEKILVSNLKLSHGVYRFKYPMKELLINMSNEENTEIKIIATVLDKSLDKVIEGFSNARLVNSSIKLKFLGDSPQLFKPGMPIITYIVASFNDNSPLAYEILHKAVLKVSTNIMMRGGKLKEIPTSELFMMSGHTGIWQYKIDLKRELGFQFTTTELFFELNKISSINIQANFTYGANQTAISKLLMLPHFSDNAKQIKVTTSTITPRVGEYMKLHIQSNYYVIRFYFVIIAKGIILLTGVQDMYEYTHTMDILLIAEMVPAATMVVWTVDNDGVTTADSLNFPVYVNSKNKYKVFITNKESSNDHKVKVEIHGQPGSFVGLSSIDRTFYSMNTENELTYAKVIKKLGIVNDLTKGTLNHTWISHEENPEELVSFPSSSYEMDANRTFEYAGLLVISNVILPRKPYFCKGKKVVSECVNGRCEQLRQLCELHDVDRYYKNETVCRYDKNSDLSFFRKYRLNRLQRQYDNPFWKDIIIGREGKFIFEIPVSTKPINWTVSAFSVNPSMGLATLDKTIEYTQVFPFFIKVEMPNICVQGEEVAIRVTIFNYMTHAIEATIGLPRSSDYKYINSIITPYNVTNLKNFSVYINAQDATVVHILMIPMRLGDIYVTVNASTSTYQYQVTRKLHVKADGLPQYRHRSEFLHLKNQSYVKYIYVNVTEPHITSFVIGSTKARISITGNIIGSIFPTMPMNATSLLNLPIESAEQNMFGFATTMYNLVHMRFTQQRNNTLERDAVHYMNIMYQKLLSFIKPDGSFGNFRSDWNHSDSSVWLTAYCVKVLKEVSFYASILKYEIYIDPSVIDKGVEWVLQHQNKNGAFYDRKYNTFPNSEGNITMTAHVLTMLNTLKMPTSKLGLKVAVAQKKAINWLESNINLIQLGKDYNVAIVAYALIKSNAPKAEIAYKELYKRGKMENGLMYWGRESVPVPPYKIENHKHILLPRLPDKYDSENIKATAYALMALVAKQENCSYTVVKWLNIQRLTDGGWASTIDTANAMEALVAYTLAQSSQDIYNLYVTVQDISLSGKTETMYINDRNGALLHYLDIPRSSGAVKVQVTGSGDAIVQTSIQYNVDVKKFQPKPLVNAFDLWTRQHVYGSNGSHINYVSCQRWNHLEESVRSGFTVLDVTIPTGYIIEQQNLDSYVLSGEVKNLQRAKFQERKVSFFFDYLDKNESCVNFTVERLYPVGKLSKYLPIRVYDYYAPEWFNETIFDTLPMYDFCHACGSILCGDCLNKSVKSVNLRIPLSIVVVVVILVNNLRFLHV